MRWGVHWCKERNENRGRFFSILGRGGPYVQRDTREREWMGCIGFWGGPIGSSKSTLLGNGGSGGRVF